MLHGLARLGIALLLTAASATALAADVAHPKGLLWRIDPPGSSAASHLFGTIHSDSKAVLDLPASVRQAFTSAERYAFELDFGEGIQREMTQAMLNRSGRPISEHLREDQWEQLAQLARARGMPPQRLNRMTPWAVALTLATPDVQPRATLDRVLYQRARRRDRPITGLETVEEQIETFAGLSKAKQLDMLRQVIELGAAGRIQPLFDELEQAWLAEDLARLVEISESNPMMGSAEAQATLEERLVDARNARMAERMQPLLERGAAFVAVGALHLPGDGGILSRLERAGYTVERVE